jgi:hypothetical protein
MPATRVAGIFLSAPPHAAEDVVLLPEVVIQRAGEVRHDEREKNIRRNRVGSLDEGTQRAV